MCLGYIVLLNRVYKICDKPIRKKLCMKNSVPIKKHPIL